jgi:cytochrome c-type biogenesis protein
MSVPGLGGARVPLAFTLGAFAFFSPCAYPLLPGYVSYYLGTSARGDGGTPASAAGTGATTSGATAAGRPLPGGRLARVARAAGVGAVVSVGFFLVYGLLAGVVVVAGSGLLANVVVLELVVGLALVLLGGAMTLGYELPTARVALPERRRSTAGYLSFGVLYAAAAAGCSAPLFVGVALRGLAAGPAAALATLAAYALGMSVLMIGVTVAAALGRDALLRGLSGRTALLRRVAGVLLVLAGLAEVYLFAFRFDGLRLLGLA